MIMSRTWGLHIKEDAEAMFFYYAYEKPSLKSTLEMIMTSKELFIFGVTAGFKDRE